MSTLDINCGYNAQAIVDHSSLWTRNRQVQVAPLLTRAEENARLGRPPAEAVVINMGDILADDPALLNAIKPKKHETLFGPSLGDINPGPAWTSYGKQDNVKDELTQETVKAWIAKSKEVGTSPLLHSLDKHTISPTNLCLWSRSVPVGIRPDQDGRPCRSAGIDRIVCGKSTERNVHTVPCIAADVPGP